jgi:hypothetical protein
VKFSIAVPARPTVDGMNAQLAKTGVYDALMKQRLNNCASRWKRQASVSGRTFRSPMLKEVRTFQFPHVTN